MHENITPKMVTVKPLYRLNKLSFFEPYKIPKMKRQKRNSAFPTYSNHVCENFSLFKKNITGIQYNIAAIIANLLKYKIDFLLNTTKKTASKIIPSCVKY